MSKFVAMVGILMLVGAAASYPAWSQLMSQVGPALENPDSTSVAGSNSSAVNATLPLSQPVENQSQLDIVPYGTQNSTLSVPYGSGWVSQFFSIINYSRGGPTLSPCASLDSFAAQRFQTMTTGTNWEITHYGYSQDEGQAFGGVQGFFAEEYFYPTEPQPVTPQAFAQHIQATAPGHWSDLMSSAYQYYGVEYQGVGPLILWQTGCGPTELGPGVNMTQEYSSCSPKVVNGPWLVIELGSVCPSV